MTDSQLISEALDCGSWPDWMHEIVDEVTVAIDEDDFSTEQAIALGVLIALQSLRVGN